jgi:hypothetical protein
MVMPDARPVVTSARNTRQGIQEGEKCHVSVLRRRIAPSADICDRSVAASCRRRSAAESSSRAAAAVVTGALAARGAAAASAAPPAAAGLPWRSRVSFVGGAGALFSHWWTAAADAAAGGRSASTAVPGGRSRRAPGGDTESMQSSAPLCTTGSRRAVLGAKRGLRAGCGFSTAGRTVAAWPWWPGWPGWPWWPGWPG